MTRLTWTRAQGRTRARLRCWRARSSAAPASCATSCTAWAAWLCSCRSWHSLVGTPLLLFCEPGRVWKSLEERGLGWRGSQASEVTANHALFWGDFHVSRMAGMPVSVRDPCCQQCSCFIVTHAPADVPSAGEHGQGASRVVDIIRLFSAITDDSPSNRQSMLQISGALACIDNIFVYLSQKSVQHLEYYYYYLNRRKVPVGDEPSGLPVFAREKPVGHAIALGCFAL